MDHNPGGPAALAAVFLHVAFAIEPTSRWPAIASALLGLAAAGSLCQVAKRPIDSWRAKLSVYVPFALFWIAQLQGLRHAHPAMILAMLAMAAYLAVYPVLFVMFARRLSRVWPAVLSVPVAWMTTELVRNYFATGISIGMLGHTAAGVPEISSIATIGGTLAVSTAMMMAAVAMTSARRNPVSTLGWLPIVASVFLWSVGWTGSGDGGEGDAGDNRPVVALVQRDETVEYGQSLGRDSAIFEAYLRQTVRSVGRHDGVVDVVVWPESMLTGGVPWMVATDEMVVPPDAGVSRGEFVEAIEGQRRFFTDRMDFVQRRIAAVNDGVRPRIVGGCGVIQYGRLPRTYSGLIVVEPSGNVSQWYGKRHLVMFGEYIPVIGWIWGLRNLIPPGLGVSPGESSRALAVGGQLWLPTICIETAVERVAVGAIGQSVAAGDDVDAIVTVTNDGWFDHSAVVSHHRRAAQMVAAATGHPILSAANGGPTMTVDAAGRLVRSLAYEDAGAIIGAAPGGAGASWYTRVGDGPAGVVAVVALGVVLRRWVGGKLAATRSRRVVGAGV